MDELDEKKIQFFPFEFKDEISQFMFQSQNKKTKMWNYKKKKKSIQRQRYEEDDYFSIRKHFLSTKKQ